MFDIILYCIIIIKSFILIKKGIPMKTEKIKNKLKEIERDPEKYIKKWLPMIIILAVAYYIISPRFENPSIVSVYCNDLNTIKLYKIEKELNSYKKGDKPDGCFIPDKPLDILEINLNREEDIAEIILKKNREKVFILFSELHGKQNIWEK